MVLTKRLKILCALAVAVGVYIVVSGTGQDAAPVAAPADRATHAAAAPPAVERGAARGATATSGNLLSRLAHRVTESKAVEALFHTQSWYVAPPPPPPAPVVVVVPPPPTAPPLPFTVMGSYARPGDAKVYFLTRGDRVFDVHIGDTIDNTYSVDAEANGELVLTYKPLNIKQTLAIGGTQ
jgi:nucleoid-associated protein YgaU